MAVRSRLREVLEEVDLSQSAPSREPGVSFATTNCVCTNATRRVDLGVIDQLCRTLGLEAGVLFSFLPDTRRKGG